MHVKQSPRVGWELFDRCNELEGVAHVGFHRTAVVRLVAGKLVPCGVEGGGAGAAGILPLRLGGQPVQAAVSATEPAAEGLHVLPAHTGHRHIRLAEEVLLPGPQAPLPAIGHIGPAGSHGLRVPRGFGEEAVLGIGDLCGLDIVGIQIDLMRRALIVLPLVIAPAEGPGWNEHELHAIGVSVAAQLRGLCRLLLPSPHRRCNRSEQQHDSREPHTVNWPQKHNLRLPP